MDNSNSRKNKRIFFLFLITTTISFFTFSQLNWNFNESSSNSNSPTGFELFDELKISDYSSTFVNTSENMNITLHQSYLNTSFDTVVITSIVNGNNFTIPSPTDTSFNSSITKFTIRDIQAPNKTLIIEDEELAFNELLDKAYYTSFQLPNDGYIENISIQVSTTTNQYLGVWIYNASWDGTYLKYDVPNTAVKQITNVNHASPLWENITNWHQLLDPANTDNNTFFVRVRSELDANANWYEGSDGTYDSIVWAHGSSTPELGIDMTLKLGLSPINETPSPEQIKLKINDKTASGYGDNINKGYWASLDVNSSDTGNLKYNVTAEWWDVECNITQVLINYTKTDLRAISSFQIPGSGLDVAWNVTRNGGLKTLMLLLCHVAGIVKLIL